MFYCGMKLFRIVEKNAQIGACLANMDCTANKTELIVPQIFWGGIPGASSVSVRNDFLTFLEQASCFLNHESTIKAAIADLVSCCVIEFESHCV